MKCFLGYSLPQILIWLTFLIPRIAKITDWHWWDIWEFIIRFFFFNYFGARRTSGLWKTTLYCIRYKFKIMPVLTHHFYFRNIFALIYPWSLELGDDDTLKIIVSAKESPNYETCITSFSRFDNLYFQSYHGPWVPVVERLPMILQCFPGFCHAQQVDAYIGWALWVLVTFQPHHALHASQLFCSLSQFCNLSVSFPYLKSLKVRISSFLVSLRYNLVFSLFSIEQSLFRTWGVELRE